MDAAEKYFDDSKKPKKEAPKQDDSRKVAALEREKKQLMERLEITKNQHKIDLQHAKQKAKEMYEKIIEDKLTACRKAYEEEFETLALQFEDFKFEIDDSRKKWAAVQNLVAAQES